MARMFHQELRRLKRKFKIEKRNRDWNDEVE